MRAFFDGGSGSSSTSPSTSPSSRSSRRRLSGADEVGELELGGEVEGLPAAEKRGEEGEEEGADPEEVESAVGYLPVHPQLLFLFSINKEDAH